MTAPAPIRKVDAHHHLWTLASANHPMLRAPGVERFYGNTDGLKRDFAIGDFLPLAERQNVVKSVYVETGYQPAAEEAAAMQSIADAHGFPHAILGHGDLRSPDIGALLDVQTRSANFRGLRLSLNWSPDVRLRSAPSERLMRDADWRGGFTEMARRGLIADLMLLPAQMIDAAELATAFADTQIVINHTGLPADRSDKGLRAWREGLAALAQRPNVAIKISGLGMVMHDWTTPAIAPLVESTIDLFGVDRCMFASNFPVDALHGGWDDIWDAFDTLTAHRPPGERAKLFHDNAVRIYRL